MNAPLPRIIQGGMGVAVSSWRLARAVSLRGQLGVVSGTGIDTVVARRLQMGDPGGHLRTAFDAFPVPEIAGRVWERHYIEGGKAPGAAYKSKAVPSIKMPSALLDLIVLSNFAEVYLAKAGHTGQVGINLLEKVQLPNLATLYGAMLAGVDYVLMGAGIPRSIPAVLDHFAAGEPAELTLDVAGALPGEKFVSRFDPRSFLGDAVRPLQAAAIPGGHLVFDAGAHSRAQEQWTGRRLRRRRPERRWSQRSAPRRESSRRQRRAGLRTARCAGPGADSSTGTAVLAGRIVR